MRSRMCLLNAVIFSCTFVLCFSILPSLANINKEKQYVLNYGEDLGEALIEFNEEAHTAIITANHESSPTTLINFFKGIVVYISPNNCMVAKIKVGERRYKDYVIHAAKSRQQLPKTFYVMGSIVPNQAENLIGKDLFVWCKNKTILRLSKWSPHLPSMEFSSLEETAVQDTNEGHGRSKRSTKKGKKSKRRKGKNNRSRSKKNRQNKNRKSKKNNRTPQTKSLRKNRQQRLNLIAPRIEFPSAQVPLSLSDNLETMSGANDHVILQEEPYLSPSFIRSDDNKVGFQHYQNFYHEAEDHSRMNVPSPVNHIISQDTSQGIDGQSKISIPESIVKDGQIFYRYDVNANSVDDKSQNKRSHTSNENIDGTHDEVVENYDYYDESLNSHSPNAQNIPMEQIDPTEFHDSMRTFGIYDFTYPQDMANVHTQGHMDRNTFGASAGAISGAGSSNYVHGQSDSGGYFIAQAHSVDGQDGQSLTHVFGNKHAVQGSAMTSNHGHQGHVQLHMGSHPSSTAQVTSNEGSHLLTSSVQASQFSGNAGAHAHGNVPSSANAHMEFIPNQQYHKTYDGFKNHGAASATMSNSGSGVISSLSGQIPSGSYFGTAYSNTGENFSFENENNTLNREDSPYDNYVHGELNNNRILQQQSEKINGNIMETVHQPSMDPKVVIYPASKLDTIDKSGLTVGTGTPPRESEIGQIPLRNEETIQQGDKSKKPGIVGLATYSHGLLGAPPGPGELLTIPYQESPYYDYDYLANFTYPDYLDKNYINRENEYSENMPHFDLGPEIVDFKPQESDFADFKPMIFHNQHSNIPIDQLEHSISHVTDSDKYNITPDPPIVVHQLQTLTYSPDNLTDDTLLPTTSFPSTASPISSETAITSKLLANETVQIPSASISQTTAEPFLYHASPFGHASSTHDSLPQTSQGTKRLYGSSSHQNSYHSETNSRSGTWYNQENYTDLENNQSTLHQQNFTRNDTTQHAVIDKNEDNVLPGIQRNPISTNIQHKTSALQQNISVSDQNVSRNITQSQRDQDHEADMQSNAMMMPMITLHPGLPGSSRIIPSSEGRPNINVMTLENSNKKSGNYLESGQKIPGTNGFIVPPGFRARIVLGQNLPGHSRPQIMSKGFIENIKMPTKQGTRRIFSDRTGGEAGRHTNVRFSNGRGDRRGLGNNANGENVSQTLRKYSTRAPQKSWNGQRYGMLPQKSWDSQRNGRPTSQKSWRNGKAVTNNNEQGRQNGDECSQYSMECEAAYGPYEGSQICRPVLITIECCC